MRGTGMEKEVEICARIPDDGKVPQKTPVFLCVIHHRQNPSESTRNCVLYSLKRLLQIRNILQINS
jgi:hypothetical protein